MPNRRPSFPHTGYRLLADLLALVKLGLTSRARRGGEPIPAQAAGALSGTADKTAAARPGDTRGARRVSRWLDWRALLTVVLPETLIRWHRQGWRLFWRWKSRPGRPPIPANLQRLIVSMARANPTWGEAPIADELLLKLGLTVSRRTVGRYLRRLRPPRGERRAQRWAIFVRNHAVPAENSVLIVGIDVIALRG